MKRRGNLVMAALLGTASVGVLATEVDFVVAAEAGKSGNTVVVRLNPNEVLVFKGATPYVLHGRRLIIVAPAIRVDAPFTIRQFDDTDTALPKEGAAAQPAPKPMGRRTSGRNGANGDTGTPGNTGAQGNSGKDAPIVVLDIKAFSGAGPLTIDNSGGTGGKGQRGSKGGTGGAGEPGADGSESAVDCKAGGADGGYGGKCGKGGTGGTGGTGGKGGTVKLSVAAMQAAAPGGPLKVIVDGGAGGEKGDGGEPGTGGAGGPGGAGTRVYCSGGSGRPSLGNGDPGSSGSPGATGQPGIVRGL